ncbi:alpha/beta fold hydrolase [Cupriavidus sp. D39]|uniref:alpha/beta fold hydrolase n=1 Tax=Cupriavidus sp. D39 TaxID=2997877 RepID=UPI00226E2B2B|nr:alpha/beta hydrolase [Cupriavidus sp. D39]MCY0854364.1 alpha/beta hydrolase [Cupriavidus sp. D39]
MLKTTLNALVLGHGPIRVIGLHGWFGNAQAWKPLADLLDSSRYTIAYLDYRGYGARIDVPGEWTMYEIAQDALQLANELGWDRFHLMGHSMGGMAIQRVMVEAPHRVGRLFAITPVPASGMPLDEATWSLFSAAAEDEAARRAIIDSSTGGRLPKHWVAGMAMRSMKLSDKRAFAAYLVAWAKTNFVERVSESSTPLHIVVGEHDPALTLERMEATTLRWFKNASIEVMPNAGHYPMDETPVALASSIERFLSMEI